MNRRKLTFTGLFIALGIIIPQMFHPLGGRGIQSYRRNIERVIYIGEGLYAVQAVG